MKRLTSVLLFTAFVSLLACNNKTEEPMVKGEATEAFDLAAARTAIDALNLKFEENFRSGDTAAIAQNYMANAIIYPPEMPAITTAELPGTFGAFRRMGIAELNLNTTSLTGDAKSMVELGTWEIFTADRAKVDNGKYLVIWTNDNGTWKISHDVWNNSSPIPRAK